MTCVWVDADACPRPVKDILFKAADKRGVDVLLVANQSLAVPRSARVRSVTVPHGFDAADDYIVEQARPGDLVVTQDIPLASQLVEAGIAVISPRGVEFDGDSIGERLAMRDFSESLRSAGQHTGGPTAFGDREKQQFANTFDRVLTRVLRDAR